MFQSVTPFSSDHIHEERLAAIHDAYRSDRSQTTLMLAHKLRVSEVEIMRALEGEDARELDFSRWEGIIRTFEALAMYMSSSRTEPRPSKSLVNSENSPMPIASSTSVPNRSIYTSAVGNWHRYLPSGNPVISMGMSRFPSSSSTEMGMLPSRSFSISAGMRQPPI